MRVYSDPTYEAWKLVVHDIIVVLYCDSDPTYEAWKQYRRRFSYGLYHLIPILSTRHGNRVEEFYSYLIAPSQPPPTHFVRGGGGKRLKHITRKS